MNDDDDEEEENRPLLLLPRSSKSPLEEEYSPSFEAVSRQASEESEGAGEEEEGDGSFSFSFSPLLLSLSPSSSSFSSPLEKGSVSVLFLLVAPFQVKWRRRPGRGGGRCAERELMVTRRRGRRGRSREQGRKDHFL